MADNYLEKKREDMEARSAREQRARQAAWKKRMDAYRRKLEAEKSENADGGIPASDQNHANSL